MSAILTKSEVAKKLRVSERTIDTLRKNDGLPYAIFGRSVRFVEEDVDMWLRNQSISTTDSFCGMLTNLGEKQGAQATN